jgi:pimeloyl-ACP methyl ester carboxylesterase
MKRIICTILTLFLFLINTSVQAAQNIVKKEITAVASDGFNIKATLPYPKIKGQKEFSTVVLLHSLGYNSQWWGDLPKELLDKGYAVLAIDLRGHGASIYNAKLAKTSWKNMKNSAYSKCADDVLNVMDVIKSENTRLAFFKNWSIVGADLGASVGVIAADKYPVEPKTIVMISPVVRAKGLYIPVNIAHLDAVDFLAISGTEDIMSKEADFYLRKFAQAEFLSFTSESKTTGMLMLKNDPGLSKMIAEWVSEYLN